MKALYAVLLALVLEVECLLVIKVENDVTMEDELASRIIVCLS